MILVIYFVRRRRRARLLNRLEPRENEKEESWVKPELDGEAKPSQGQTVVTATELEPENIKYEMDGKQDVAVELDLVNERYEMDGGQTSTAELEGSVPPTHEIDSAVIKRPRFVISGGRKE